MKTLDQWLNEYSVSHQNQINQRLHKVCVPLIFFSILGMLWDLQIAGFRGAWVFAILGMAFYLRLGAKSSLLMVLQIGLSFAILSFWSQNSGTVFLPCLTIFILAWAGQFWGHKIEGRRPSFYKDLQFLLIGPL